MMPLFMDIRIATENDALISLAGLILLFGGFGGSLISWAFCVQPLPSWLRHYALVSAGFVGLRWFTRESSEEASWLWWVALVFLNFSVAMLAMFVHIIYSALRQGGRCNDQGPPERRTKMYIGGGVILLIVVILLLVWIF